MSESKLPEVNSSRKAGSPLKALPLVADDPAVPPPPRPIHPPDVDPRLFLPIRVWTILNWQTEDLQVFATYLMSEKMRPQLIRAVERELADRHAGAPAPRRGIV